MGANKEPAVKVLDLREADIPGAIGCIQSAFAGDPYNNWVFDKATVRPF